MLKRLRDILSSDSYKNMVSKVEGKIESEKDFICKKCELSIGIEIDHCDTDSFHHFKSNEERIQSLIKHYNGNIGSKNVMDE